MAATGGSSLELSEISKFNSLSLREKFQIAVNWNEESWVSFNLNNSRLKRLVNSTKFWKPKLQEAFGECNVILTLHSEAPSGYLHPQQIVDDVVKQFPGVEVASYNRFHNPRYLNIDFTTSDMKDRVFENLANIGSFEICFLDWAPVSSNLVIRVHWLPRRVSIMKIAQSLNTYFVHHFIKFEHAVHADGKAYGCGVATFVGKLKFGVSLDSVPHILQISGLEALITIPSRPPLCLRCDVVGHLANKCKAIYCKQCKAMKDKIHECKKSGAYAKSYAQTLKEFETEDVDEDDFALENTDVVTAQEYYRVAAHAERKAGESGEQTKTEPSRKFIKVGVEGGEKDTDYTEISNKPAQEAVGTSVQSTLVEVKRGITTEDMETSQSNVDQPSLPNECKDFVVVGRRGANSKTKQVPGKEKLAKTLATTITYGTRSNKLNSKAANLFDALMEKPEGVAPTEDPPPT